MELLRRHPAQLKICDCKFAIFNQLRRTPILLSLTPRLYAFSGVRPSSVAASSASSNAVEILCPAARSSVSAPEDGRTPLNAYARFSEMAHARRENPPPSPLNGERAGVRGETGPARSKYYPAGWLRSARRCLPLVLISLVTSLFLASGRAQSAKEYDRRAACLYKLAEFVDWPAEAFASAESPIVI